MTARANIDQRWDERIRRARHLSKRHFAAAAFLTFYGALAAYQRLLAERWSPTSPSASSRQAPLANTPLASLNKGLVLDAVPEFLIWLDRAAPAHIVAAVSEPASRKPRAKSGLEWTRRLDDYLTGLATDAEVDHSPQTFVLEVLLQPLAELLAEGVGMTTPTPASRCPFCNSLPVVGLLREEGEGARRSLVCGLCSTEWRHPRVVCPACGESKFDALAAYTAEQISGARIDACDTCRAYLKTIDMTKDGLALPLVDDLASVSLDLWAREQGYVRIRPNLLRT